MFITSIFDTADALFDAARNLLQSTAQDAQRTACATLLPGGKTPLPLFRSIEAAPFPVADNFCVGYTDERLVPVDDLGNNFALSMGMLAALGIGDDKTLRVDTELSLEEAAAKYDGAWRAFFDNGGVIPLAFLGLGADGHTCSLFTSEQISACPPDRFAVAAPQETKPDRVTVTPALLGRVNHAVILATGPEKAAIVDAMTNKPDTVVAGIALAQCPRVSLWYAPQA